MRYRSAGVEFNEHGLQEIWAGRASATFSGGRAENQPAAITLLPGKISVGGRNDPGFVPHNSEFNLENVSRIYDTNPYLYALGSLIYGLGLSLTNRRNFVLGDKFLAFATTIQSGTFPDLLELSQALRGVEIDHSDLCERKLVNASDSIGAVVSLQDPEVHFDIDCRTVGDAIAAIRAIVNKKFNKKAVVRVVFRRDHRKAFAYRCSMISFVENR